MSVIHEGLQVLRNRFTRLAPARITGCRPHPASCLTERARTMTSTDNTIERAPHAGASLFMAARGLTTFIEATHDLTCDHDLDGTILAVNAAAALNLGVAADRLCGMNLRDVLSEEARAILPHYLETIRREGRAEGLMTVRTADGLTRVWQYENSKVTVAGRNAIVRGLARDVTDREEALNALRASERQLRCIIENVSDAIGIVDTAGRLQFHSPSTEHLLGYRSHELAGRRLTDLVHEEDVHRANEFFEEQSSPDAPVRTIDFRIRHCDGSWRWFSVVTRPVVRSGETVSIVINARDITDRMLLEAQLEQANRVNSLGRLAATVAHEFNNVLMGIQPFADLMQRPGVTPEMVVQGARHIANSIARGKRVTLDILRFTNPARPTLDPIDVAEWWRQLAPLMQASIGDKYVLASSFSGPLIMLADAAQLSQVFANLISNARDAMPGGGTLHISARLGRPGETFAFGVVPNAERFVHFTVEDSGTGMSAKVLQHAFEPLFTTKRNGGTGLGLAVAHQAVGSHAGHIFVQSTVGVGSTFHIFIPAAEAVAAVPPAGAPVETGLHCQRILIVDDERMIGEGLAELLREHGVTVRVASTGRGALESCSDFTPELAIVDIRLPDINGLEVAR